MDILALATMKNAAKCDTQCELQNYVNHRTFERKWRSRCKSRACLFECRFIKIINNSQRIAAVNFDTSSFSKKKINGIKIEKYNIPETRK